MNTSVSSMLWHVIVNIEANPKAAQARGEDIAVSC